MRKRDARRKVRKTLDMPARVKSRNVRLEVEVSDISERGCRITGRHMYLQVGRDAVLLPEGFEGFKGTIRWVDEGQAGIEFKRPLHAAVVDHLCRSYPCKNAVLNLEFDFGFGAVPQR